MLTPQAGIFALGTSSHAYLEFDLLPTSDPATASDPAQSSLIPNPSPLIPALSAFASTIAAIHEPRTTTGGVNFVIGFRPELWRLMLPSDAPANVTGFNAPILGIEGFTMPATQHDALVWLSGSAYDVLFDMARSVIATLAPHASLADHTHSWPYRHDRDLTGFIDGSENPSLLDAPADALLPEGTPGAAGSILLLQRWPHDVPAWEAVPVPQQELIIGRTKPDSIELKNKPTTSHVARTDQDTYGQIFRRNMPYGNVTDHGTVFVGFTSDQSRLDNMLRSMAGLLTGERDNLTRYTHPTTGSYYFTPSIESLASLR